MSEKSRKSGEQHPQKGGEAERRAERQGDEQRSQTDKAEQRIAHCVKVIRKRQREKHGREQRQPAVAHLLKLSVFHDGHVQETAGAQERHQQAGK